MLTTFYLPLFTGGGGGGGGRGVVVVVVVVVVGGGGGGLGQLEEQTPQLPWFPTWSPLESVRVEHHGSVSPGLLPSRVQALWVTPLKLNGKTHSLPGSGPLTVVQPFGGGGGPRHPSPWGKWGKSWK